MRILIVNPFGIGDVLFSTPLINNLKVALPESYIGYICNRRAEDALIGNLHLDEIFVFEKDEYRALWRESRLKCIVRFISFLKKIKQRNFNLVIDLSLGQQYSLFLWLIGITRRIGYNYRNRGRFLIKKINISGYEDKPVADYYLDLLKFLNIKPTRFKLSLSVSQKDRDWAKQFFLKHKLDEKDLVIGMIPAGGASWGSYFSYRHWPWEYYAQLADKLITNLNAQVIIFGDLSEQIICQQVQNMMKEKTISACGKTTLKQFAALLAKCNLVICNDGGPLHVAVSQDVLTVSVFGPVDEKVYGPYPPGQKHIIVTKDIACRPCYKKFKVPACRHQRQCIKGISADEVLKIIENNLNLFGKR